jgi:hypothetical protein
MLNILCLLLQLLHLGTTHADLYLHYPRGSNNKLNERQQNVRNDNRLFDSQNNGNAGYNVGDDCIPACAVDTNNDNNAAPDTYNVSAPGAGQGMMYYYAGSLLNIEWTAQHGCGKENPHLDCEIIIQYACGDTMPKISNGKRIATIGGGQNDNGQNTGGTNTLTGKDLRQSPNSTMTGPEYGQHESYDYWMKCKIRERNKGLFTADKLTSTQNQQTAIFTRQGDNAERYGFECPEERDYYPYWHPTQWRDAIVLTDVSNKAYFISDIVFILLTFDTSIFNIVYFWLNRTHAAAACTSKRVKMLWTKESAPCLRTSATTTTRADNVSTTEMPTSSLWTSSRHFQTIVLLARVGRRRIHQ